MAGIDSHITDLGINLKEVNTCKSCKLVTCTIPCFPKHMLK